MSRGIQVKQSNPASKWIEWKGGSDQGFFQYYDKEAAVNVKLESLVFLVLDKVGTVSGFHEASKSSIYANQVRSSVSEKLTVKAFNQTDPLAEGLWKNIKEVSSAKGGDFTANVYSAAKGVKGLDTICVQFKKSGLSAWSEFEKASGDKINKMAVKWVGMKEGKKGAITYQMPVFELIPVSEETNAEANVLWEELQTYLKQALSSSEAEEQTTQESAPVQMDTKKTLSFTDAAFANIANNLQEGETTLADVLKKYDMDDNVLNALKSSENKAIGIKATEASSPRTTAAEAPKEPVKEDIDALNDTEEDLPF